MNARYRTAALFLTFGLAMTALVAPASADPPKSKTLYLAPGEPYGLPKFGFSSSTIYGYGERVVNVRYGGRASQLGLEPGDVILSLNGYRLTYPGSWNDALSQALYNNNFVQLKIRDVHTGNIYFRGMYVDYHGGGPVQHYHKTHTNNVPQPLINVQVGPTVKKFENVKKLTK
jgi:hypothetical protein